MKTFVKYILLLVSVLVFAGCGGVGRDIGTGGDGGGGGGGGGFTGNSPFEGVWTGTVGFGAVTFERSHINEIRVEMTVWPDGALSGTITETYPLQDVDVVVDFISDLKGLVTDTGMMYAFRGENKVHNRGPARPSTGVGEYYSHSYPFSGSVRIAGNNTMEGTLAYYVFLKDQDSHLYRKLKQSVTLDLKRQGDAPERITPLAGRWGDDDEHLYRINIWGGEAVVDIGPNGAVSGIVDDGGIAIWGITVPSEHDPTKHTFHLVHHHLRDHASTQPSLSHSVSDLDRGGNWDLVGAWGGDGLGEARAEWGGGAVFDLLRGIVEPIGADGYPKQKQHVDMLRLKKDPRGPRGLRALQQGR
jgi:hypothetical protein